MKKTILSLLLLFSISATYSQEEQPTYGVETITSEYLEQRYLYTNLVHYLDNKNLHVTYQAETTGEFNTPDRMIFSVEGSSFRWNKFYLDGFRIDSRFFAGSTLYTPNMHNFDLELDYIDSKLNFTSIANPNSKVSVSYNLGGIGGISESTESIIHIFHQTATDREYKPIDERSQIKGSGAIELDYVVKGKSGDYLQSIYANVGERGFVGFDNTGIYTLYPERYGEIQLSGEMPFTLGSLFDKTNYIVNLANREHLYSEFYYGEEESPELKSYAVSMYGRKSGDRLSYTSGFNLAFNNTEHEDLNFDRNVIDHDGEGFEPWQPDGTTMELSHSLTMDKKLNDWLTLKVDTYNSLIGFNPTQNNFQNTTYSQLTTQDEATMLHLYEWHSNKFYSALLENSAGVNIYRELTRSLTLRADLNLTLDAMLVEGNSIVSPNFEARVGFDFRPTSWLDMELNLSRERVNYNIDDIRYLSADYLSGELYYINDSNQNGIYDSGEKGGLYITSGGEYNTLSDDAKQPTYYVVDIPIHLTFGRHRISLLHSYRKYCNNWSVSFDGDYSDYGYMESVSIKKDLSTDAAVDMDLFFYDGGKEVNYTVGDYPDGIMGSNPFTSTPFYFCSNIEYSYTAPRFSISVNWQSYMMSGISTLGNGPLHNNLGSLSESSANPNTYLVVEDSESKYSAVGRLDQDRAYVARIFASYKVTDRLSVALNAKFKDGQPFSVYYTEIKSNQNGDNQLATIPVTSRGINTANDNFGTREDAIFNIDLRVSYSTKIANHNCEFSAYCYNIYDFGNELTEYIFDQDISGRRAMSLTIPRGLIFSFSMDL